MSGGAGEAGAVIWITGLSAAGKTTVARLVRESLAAGGRAAVLLDGDAIREVFGQDLGHDRAHRLENAYRISRLARMLSLQGVTVVCATMSLFKECHDWNRRHISRYFEVYLRVPWDELRRRDPKGLYRAAADGRMTGVVGVDVDYDEPADPHLVLDNCAPLTPAEAAGRIVAAAARF